MIQKLITLAILAISGGCAIPQIRPQAEVKLSFTSIDVIQITAVGELVNIVDRKTIERIGQAYSRSKWDPMPDTMPLDIVRIYGLEKGEQKFELLYGGGSIIDTEPKTGKVIRIGTLTAEDREWMHENIRLKLPPNENIFNCPSSDAFPTIAVLKEHLKLAELVEIFHSTVAESACNSTLLSVDFQNIV